MPRSAGSSRPSRRPHRTITCWRFRRPEISSGDGCTQDSATIGCQASMPQDQLRTLVNRFGAAFLLRSRRRSPGVRERAWDRRAAPEYAIVSAANGATPVIPTPRPLPRTDPPPSDLPGAVLLADDLSSARGDHLPTVSRDPGRYSAGYVGGQYEIVANRPGAQGEAIVSGTYADASIAVDAALVDATPDQYVQLACRIQGPAAQYRFGFRPGDWRVLADPGVGDPGQREPGRHRAGAHGATRAALAGHAPGGASNRAELSCHGTTIEGRVNGETVATVQDNTFSSGQVSIAAGSTPGGVGGGTRAVGHFSNLVIVAQ